MSFLNKTIAEWSFEDEDIYWGRPKPEEEINIESILENSFLKASLIESKNESSMVDSVELNQTSNVSLSENKCEFSIADLVEHNATSITLNDSPSENKCGISIEDSVKHNQTSNASLNESKNESSMVDSVELNQTSNVSLSENKCEFSIADPVEHNATSITFNASSSENKYEFSIPDPVEHNATSITLNDSSSENKCEISIEDSVKHNQTSNVFLNENKNGSIIVDCVELNHITSNVLSEQEPLVLLDNSILNTNNCNKEDVVDVKTKDQAKCAPLLIDLDEPLSGFVEANKDLNSLNLLDASLSQLHGCAIDFENNLNKKDKSLVETSLIIHKNNSLSDNKINDCLQPIDQVSNSEVALESSFHSPSRNTKFNLSLNENSKQESIISTKEKSINEACLNNSFPNKLEDSLIDLENASCDLLLSLDSSNLNIDLSLDSKISTPLANKADSIISLFQQATVEKPKDHIINPPTSSCKSFIPVKGLQFSIDKQSTRSPLNSIKKSIDYQANRIKTSIGSNSVNKKMKTNTIHDLKLGAENADCNIPEVGIGKPKLCSKLKPPSNFHISGHNKMTPKLKQHLQSIPSLIPSSKLKPIKTKLPQSNIPTVVTGSKSKLPKAIINVPVSGSRVSRLPTLIKR